MTPKIPRIMNSGKMGTGNIIIKVGGALLRPTFSAGWWMRLAKQGYGGRRWQRLPDRGE
jgi:hypothetical protein